MAKLTIWTLAYRPFIMGGDCNAPIATEVDKPAAVKIGKGITVFVVKSPSGRTFVVEQKSGAFVGSSLAQVKKDLATADPKVIRQQVKDAKELFKRATHVTEPEFWRHFRSER